MKKLVFIADFFKSDLAGGGETNDDNLLDHLRQKHDVQTTRANNVSIPLLEAADTVIVGNFVTMPEGVKGYLIGNKKYIIYEHDHKYITTRDPSRFPEFKIPRDKLVNEKFYEASYGTVVLSNVCKSILELNLPKVKVHNIGCSLWSTKTFEKIKSLSMKNKEKNLCIMKTNNPTKNYNATVEFCNSRNLAYENIHSQSHFTFLSQMSLYRKILFIPTVLETFSRLCAEAKMLNLEVMTNKRMIGFFSEECSSLSGLDLIAEMQLRNKKALKLFEGLV
jgi:hypothetical protein